MNGACVDCKHCVIEQQGQVFLCRHPKYQDRVTGKAITPCIEIRSNVYLSNLLRYECGDSGNFFEPKEVTISG